MKTVSLEESDRLADKVSKNIEKSKRNNKKKIKKNKIRVFNTGATRNLDDNKPDYEGFLSSKTNQKYNEFLEQEQNFAWAAGLFEGEGCIMVMKSKGRLRKNGTYNGKIYKNPRLCMSMTDEDIIRRFHAIFGGTVRGPYIKQKKLNRKPIWYWQANGKIAINAAQKMYPYLGIRRKNKIFEVFGTKRTAEIAHIEPSVIIEYGKYMQKHRVQADGTLRDSDNWQKGIPKEEYMKSAFRHFLSCWISHREGTPNEDELCALMFNIHGYLHEVLKERNYK